MCLCLIPFSMSVLVSITPYYGLLMCGTLLMLVCAGYALILTCMVDRKKPIRVRVALPSPTFPVATLHTYAASETHSTCSFTFLLGFCLLY